MRADRLSGDFVKGDCSPEAPLEVKRLRNVALSVKPIGESRPLPFLIYSRSRFGVPIQVPEVTAIEELHSDLFAAL